MTNDDYKEILQETRKLLMQRGLGGVDERIMSDIHGSEGPFWDLMYYLKHLSEEVSLGADTKLSSVLRRFRHYVGTESGDMVEGIRELCRKKTGDDMILITSISPPIRNWVRLLMNYML